MEVNELIKKVKKIELKAKGLSQQVFSGGYHSTFKGRGMSFAEVRDYTPGDDVRSIDWNVTARTGSPFVKVFEEERELTVNLLIDLSGSQHIGSQYAQKREFMAEIVGLIAFSAMTNNDRVGAIFFTDKIEKYLPPKKGKSNILRIIREVIQLQPDSKATDIEVAIKYLNNVQKKRSICFMLSDFIGQLPLADLTIAAKRHDMIGLHIYDIREKEVPDVGYVRTKDSETNQTFWLNTSNKRIREHITDSWITKSNFLKHQMQRVGATYLDICVGEDYVKKLIQMFKSRL